MTAKRALLTVIFMVTLIFTVSQSYAAVGGTSVKARIFELDFERALVDLSFSERQHSLAEKDGDKAAADLLEDRSIMNSTETGNLLKSYYGKTTSYLFSNLFVAHSAANIEYTHAAIEKNAASMKQAEKKLNDSADAIMAFLAELSPKNLSSETLRPHFDAYISKQLEQIKMLESGDLEAEDEAWEQLIIKSSNLGSAIAQGIVKEFPKKF